MKAMQYLDTAARSNINRKYTKYVKYTDLLQN